MDGTTILTWIVIGLIAGVLASMVVGNGYGIIGDIVVGIVGAFLGSWLFRVLGWSAPWGGLAGTILVAFIGACVLLLVLRLIHSSYARGV
ncbi:MAG: GlsB/YeaQ/YmgE family stress response membrane protein [Kofleriaceae bacterium]